MPKHSVSGNLSGRVCGRLRLLSVRGIVKNMDAALRDELRGWYHIKRRFVENEVGQRFYFDFYGAKWLAFANGPGNI